MVREISGILSDREPSIYMYGSSVLNDFRLGWSDIDILVLTDKQITEEQAKTLVGLRQAMLAKDPGNPYYRSFEGGMLTLNAFLSNKSDCVVYWGTSGERITDSYVFDSFSMAELTESSVLLYGKNIPKELMFSHFGVSPSDAVYFSDDNDDIEPIKNCGLGVAVSNAIPSVLDIADRILDSNDMDGVAKFIEENIL